VVRTDIWHVRCLLSLPGHRGIGGCRGAPRLVVEPMLNG
jgi:hypothetical protein